MRSVRFSSWLLVCALALCGRQGFAQEQSGDKPQTLSLAAKLVSLPVVVRDKKGQIVHTLNKPDFALQVDGATQPIRYFDKDDDLPLTLGLLVDTSGSVHARLDEERTASEGFLDGMMGTRPAAASLANAPDKAPAEKPAPDRGFVIQFAHEVDLLQDLTDSKPKLKAALRELDTPSFGGQGGGGGNNGGGNGNGGSGNGNGGNGNGGNGNDNGNGNGNGGQGNGGGGRGGRGGGGGGGGTALYDAVYLSGNEVMAKEHGRKAIIILSDGDDRGSKKSLASSIEAAQRADTIIYAIYYKGNEGGGGGQSRGPFGGGGGGFPGGGGRRGGGGGGGYPGGGGQQGGGRGGGTQVDGKKVLQRMADETGGRLFEVKGKETVATIYTQIAEELRSQYRLGYSPDAANAADGYHQVTVTVPKEKNYRIQTRDGYYTGAK